MKLRISVGLAVVVALIVGLFVWMNRDAALTPAEDAAAAWLVDQVPSDTSLFESRYGENDDEVFVDYGLNLDLAEALRKLDEYEAADRVYAAVLKHVDEYAEVGGVMYPGAVAKLATHVEQNGDDPTAVEGRDLIADLKGLMIADGEEAGRFKDDPDGEFQSANTIVQSWGVRALDGVDEDTGSAVDFLAAQQCEDGGFRLYQTGDTCESAVDATVFAVEALEAVSGHDTRIDNAVAWLIEQQLDDGSFQADGLANANSTGLAAGTLADHGEKAAAERAAGWIRTLQLTAGPDTGAVGLGEEAVTSTGSADVDPLVLDQFMRATVQVVRVLHLGGDG